MSANQFGVSRLLWLLKLSVMMKMSPLGVVGFDVLEQFNESWILRASAQRVYFLASQTRSAP